MQSKSSIDLERRSSKRKHDSTSNDDDPQTMIRNKKMRILCGESDLMIDELTNNQIEEKSRTNSNKILKDQKTDAQNESQVNGVNSEIQSFNYQVDNSINQDLKLDNNLPNTRTETIDLYQVSSGDPAYLKYYLTQMNQQASGKEDSDKQSILNHHNLEKSEKNEFRIENQLNYVQMLNYQCLMAKSMEANKNVLNRNLFLEKNFLFDKTQLKSKLIDYSSLNDQQINHLNSQLINSPGFKQLIEKNRTLRLNLAYQKLQAENPNFPCLPLRTVRPCRRQRTTFTNEQTIKLEIEYRQNEYISRNKRFQLADLLDLSENQIKIWFQNRRAKDKRLERAILDQQLKQIWN